MIDAQLYYTLWLAEVPITIVTAVILRAVLRESQPTKPDIRPSEILPRRNRRNQTIEFVALIRNRGETAGIDCQARLALSDVKSEDIV